MGLFSRHVELLDIARGAQHWRYALGDQAITIDSAVYSPAPLQRGEINQTADLARNTLDLTAPQGLGFLDQFRGRSPMQTITVVLKRQQISDSSVATLWQGVIGGATFETHDAKIHCLPPMASMQSLGLRRNWQHACPHALYGAGLGACNASAAAVQTYATVTSVNGNVVHATAFAAQADGWWSGGYFQWNDGLTHEVRFIVSHAGDAVTLLTPGLIDVGTTVTAYPGCDHTLAICDTKFSNAANYGGQPWIPEKNPFGSDNIF